MLFRTGILDLLANAFGLVLAAAIVASALDVQVPYYGCVRNDGLSDHVPGVCSTFSAHRLDVSVPDGATFSWGEAQKVCEISQGLNEAMSKATLDWSLAACMGYLKSFVDLEVIAHLGDLTPAGSLLLENGLDKALETHYKAIDAITESFGAAQFIEGNIWRYGRDDDAALREKLANKRQCLLTSLAAAVPTPAAVSAAVGGSARGGRVAEIGFNAGHSAASILTALPGATLFSFDICAWPYSRTAHAYLENHFNRQGSSSGVGERTRLICGDSAASIKEFGEEVAAGNEQPFDAIFIDGGHTYLQALTDLRQSASVVRPGAFVVVDDCEQDPSHDSMQTEGAYAEVGAAWRHTAAEGFVVPLPSVCGHVGLCIGHYRNSDSGKTAADSLATVEKSSKLGVATGAGGGGVSEGDDVTLTFLSPKHGDTVDGDEVEPRPRFLVVEVHVDITPPNDISSSSGRGGGGDWVREFPEAWEVCCEAARVLNVTTTAATAKTGGSEFGGSKRGLTCARLGRGSLAAVPLPGRSEGDSSPEGGGVPVEWRLEVWLEATGSGLSAIPRQRRILGLSSIRVFA